MVAPAGHLLVQPPGPFTAGPPEQARSVMEEGGPGAGSGQVVDRNRPRVDIRFGHGQQPAERFGVIALQGLVGVEPGDPDVADALATLARRRGITAADMLRELLEREYPEAAS